MRKRYGPLRAFAFLFLLALIPDCSSADTQRLWQMDHASWTVRDGVPRGINAIAQAPDGMLWIASERGLYSFDGFEFKQAEATADPNGDLQRALTEVLAAKDGTVWFSTGSHGVAQLAKGHLQTFNKASGRNDLQGLRSLQEDRTGTIWALFDDKVPAFLGADHCWHISGAPLGEGPHIQSFFVDDNGAQWVVQSNQLYRKATHAGPFTAMHLDVFGPSSISAAFGSHGGVWIGSAGWEKSHVDNENMSLIQLDAAGRVLTRLPNLGPIKTWIAARNGEIWMVTNTVGLQKLDTSTLTIRASRNRIQGDHFAQMDGLVSDRPNTLFEDTDGNFWSGGTHGIDRFSPAVLQPALRVQNTSLWSSCIDGHNDLLLAAESSPLFRLHHGKQIIRGVHDVSGLYCDGHFAWALDAKGIERIEGNRSTRLPALPDHSGFWDDYIFSTICQVDKQTLYAWATGANEDSLWVYHNKRWSRIGGKERFGRVISMRRIDKGRLLMGTRDGKVEQFDGTDLAVLPVRNGEIQSILAFGATSEGAVALAYSGIAVKQRDAFLALPFASKLSGKRVTGLVQSNDGAWWVNSAAGITRYSLAEVRETIKHPKQPLFGEQISKTSATAPLPYAFTGGSAHKDAAGRLWFGTMDGIVSVDAEHLPVTPLPRLKIVGLSGDGKAGRQAEVFGPDLQTLRIQYAGVQMTEPSSIVYRYRLEGHDNRWLDVGPRREAVYTDLKPGHYRFAVMASVGKTKHWVGPVFSSPFTVEPHLYQTFWFRVFCLLAGLAILYLAVRFRLQHVARLYRLQADARAAERIRISRTLHDTLLQGLQGLILRFESLRKSIEPSASAQEAFEGALLRAEQLVVESRTHLIELRTETPDTRQLASALMSVSEAFRQTNTPAFRVQVHGEPRCLLVTAYFGVYQIAAAAITNAFLHSRATTLKIQLRYGQDHLEVSCNDDGIGMSEAIARHGKSGHLGIIGMREQARELGAHFELITAVGVGTTVRLRLQAAVAYRDEGGT